MSGAKEKRYTNFSFETFDSAYHALKRFDSLPGILAGVVSILCKVVRGCLYGAKFALNILLSGAEDLAVILVWNLVWGFRGQNREMGVRPTLANGCSKIKRPSRPGLVVAMDRGEMIT